MKTDFFAFFRNGNGGDKLKSRYVCSEINVGKHYFTMTLDGKQKNIDMSPYDGSGRGSRAKKLPANVEETRAVLAKTLRFDIEHVALRASHVWIGDYRTTLRSDVRIDAASFSFTFPRVPDSETHGIAKMCLRLREFRGISALGR